jgi:hypothetical protein
MGLYPRRVSIFATEQTIGPSAAATVGEVAYQGRLDSVARNVLDEETPLFEDVPCDIMLKRAGRSRGQSLPSDAMASTMWSISFPAWALPLHSLRDEYIIRDDEGYRYIIGSNFWTILGYQVEVIRLEM